MCSTCKVLEPRPTKPSILSIKWWQRPPPTRAPQWVSPLPSGDPRSKKKKSSHFNFFSTVENCRKKILRRDAHCKRNIFLKKTAMKVYLPSLPTKPWCAFHPLSGDCDNASLSILSYSNCLFIAAATLPCLFGPDKRLYLVICCGCPNRLKHPHFVQPAYLIFFQKELRKLTR